MGGDAAGRVMVTLRGDDAAGHLVESTEINGIQGFEYGFALDNSDRRLDHLVTVARGNQGAARVQNAMLILPIREEVCVWEFVSCVLFPDLGLQPLVHRAQFIRILDLVSVRVKGSEG